MKKILLSSLLAVMAVTSANAKIASTNYVDEVAQTKADAAQAAAKTYTDQEIGALDSTAVATGTNDGKYATVVTQTDGKISTERVRFDGVIDANSTAFNAPTSLAVKTFVDRAITGVNGDVSGKVSINQGVANKDKGLIVNASGELELADVATDAELGTVSDIAAQAKAGVSNINNSDVMKSGITATKVATYDGYATGKQNALSDTQLAAVNSGITAAKVTTYDGYATRKQDTLTTAQLAAANSGITAAKVTTYDGYATGKQDTLTTAQLAAVNSGVTADKVATYDAYDARIRQNKDYIAPIASAPVATEGSEDGQYVLTKKVVDGATTYSWELIDRALAN